MTLQHPDDFPRPINPRVLDMGLSDGLTQKLIGAAKCDMQGIIDTPIDDLERITDIDVLEYEELHDYLLEAVGESRLRGSTIFKEYYYD